jgi:hypothetical protein
MLLGARGFEKLAATHGISKAQVLAQPYAV